MNNSCLNKKKNLQSPLRERRLWESGTVTWCGFLIGVILFCSTKPALAYIDFGVGSMLVQLLLGGIAGALVIIKFYWARIKDWYRRVFRSNAQGKKRAIPRDQGDESKL